MTKPRRKTEIRADALRKLATLREEADARAAFLQPQPRSWHESFLCAVRRGDSLEQAASASGITRQGVYHARRHQPRFNEAFQAAYVAGGKSRRKRQSCAYRARAAERSSTTKENSWTQKGPDDSVTLGKSNFTLRVGRNGPAEGYPLRSQGDAGLVNAR